MMIACVVKNTSVFGDGDAIRIHVRWSVCIILSLNEFFVTLVVVIGHSLVTAVVLTWLWGHMTQ